MFNNMVELTSHLNETIVKSQQTPDCTDSEAKLNTIKWKNLSIRYVKQVKTLEAAIFQKQKEVDRLHKVSDKKYGNGGYGKEVDPDEMVSLIGQDFNGDDSHMGTNLKQRSKGGSHGETFEEFMRRRSKRIGKDPSSLMWYSKNY